MGIFAGIEKATIGGRLPYMTPGFRGLVTIQKTLYKEEDFKGNKPIIVEFLIKTTNLPVELPVGTKRSWYRQMTHADPKKSKSTKEKALGELKAYLLGVFGIFEKDADLVAQVSANAETYLEEAVGAKQSFYGKDVGLETLSLPPLAPGGSPFTLFLWKPASVYAPVAADIAA